MKILHYVLSNIRYLTSFRRLSNVYKIPPGKYLPMITNMASVICLKSTICLQNVVCLYFHIKSNSICQIEHNYEGEMFPMTKST